MQKIILIGIFFWLQYSLWFGKNGIQDFYQTKNKIIDLEKKNKKIKEKSINLKKKIKILKMKKKIKK